MRLGLTIAALGRCLSLSARAATWMADSTSYEDVRAAVWSASAGDTVQVPAGSSIWTNTLTLTNGITLAGAGTNATIITNAMPLFDSNQQPLFLVQLAADDAPLTIRGFHLSGYGTNTQTGITSSYTTPHETQVRITQCLFTGLDPAMMWKSAYGVIDACEFVNCRFVSRVNGYWTSANLYQLTTPPWELWTSTNYMVFENISARWLNWTTDTYGFDTEMPANYMVRFSTFYCNRGSNIGIDGMDMHGSPNTNVLCGPGMVAYGNTWTRDGHNGDTSFMLADVRGGNNSLVFSNSVIATNQTASVRFRNNLDYGPLMTNSWCWANTLNSTGVVSVTTADGVTIGVNVFTSSPPVLSLLTYPHPLVTAQDGGGSRSGFVVRGNLNIGGNLIKQ